jgi:hypothetical protein
MTIEERLSAAVQTLKEVSQTHPQLVEAALKPFYAERQWLVRRDLAFVVYAMLDAQQWTSKHCIDCVSQRERAAGVIKFLRMAEDISSTSLIDDPDGSHSAREEAERLQERVAEYRREIRRTKTDVY